MLYPVLRERPENSHVKAKRNSAFLLWVCPTKTASSLPYKHFLTVIQHLSSRITMTGNDTRKRNVLFHEFLHARTHARTHSKYKEVDLVLSKSLSLNYKIKQTPKRSILVPKMRVKTQDKIGKVIFRLYYTVIFKSNYNLVRFDNDCVIQSKYYLNFVPCFRSHFGYHDISFRSLFYIIICKVVGRYWIVFEILL